MLSIILLALTFLCALAFSEHKDQIPLKSGPLDTLDGSNQYTDHIGVGLDFSSNYA